MGRLTRSSRGVMDARKNKSVRSDSKDFKDVLLAQLEIQQTRSQLQIEHWERLHAETKSAGQRLEAIYQHAPIGYITFDEKGLIVEWNAMAAELLEGGTSPLLNAPLTFFAIRDHVELLLEHLRRCRRAAGGQIITELRLRKGKGEVPVQIVSVPFKDGGKRCFPTALIDLTERKKSERALEETKQFAETIIQLVHEPLVVLDAHLRILQTNEAFTKLFRIHGKLVKGMPFDSILNLWWQGNGLRAQLEQAVLKGIPVDNFEFEVQLKKQGRRIFLFNARRVSSKGGAPRTLLVALEDITARKQAEEQLAKTNHQLQHLNDDLEKRVEDRTKELRESNKHLEGFCYSIAHDLRAPLRAMAGFSAALLDDIGPQIGEHERGYLRKIVEAGQQMDTLIRDLLEYGRFSTIDFDKKVVDADEVLSGVIANMQPAISGKQAQIDRVGRLPKVLGHKAVLEAAFSNLLSNALKFVPANRPPKITIWPEDHDEQIRIWVADNGIGIEPRYYCKIFEAFQRLHSQMAYPGTGIGLAIVQRALQRIGGNVGVESEIGKGSRFWISMRRAAEAA